MDGRAMKSSRKRSRPADEKINSSAADQSCLPSLSFLDAAYADTDGFALSRSEKRRQRDAGVYVEGLTEHVVNGADEVLAHDAFPHSSPIHPSSHMHPPSSPLHRPCPLQACGKLQFLSHLGLNSFTEGRIRRIRDVRIPAQHEVMKDHDAKFITPVQNGVSD